MENERGNIIIPPHKSLVLSHLELWVLTWHLCVTGAFSDGTHRKEQTGLQDGGLSILVNACGHVSHGCVLLELSPIGAGGVLPPCYWLHPHPGWGNQRGWQVLPSVGDTHPALETESGEKVLGLGFAALALPWVQVAPWQNKYDAAAFQAGQAHRRGRQRHAGSKDCRHTLVEKN